MKSEESNSINLFQQIGQIQGTVNAQGASNAAAFAAISTTIRDFQTEFRLATNDQNKKIEDLRKEMSDNVGELSAKTSMEIRNLSDEVETLKQFKANYEGAKSEAKKNAQWSGGLTGATAGGVIIALTEIIRYLVHMPK